MKSFLIIGMGRFGSHLCQNLAKLGNEVMIIDQNEELLEPLLPYVTDAKIGDCTKEEVLKSLGVGNFDSGHFGSARCGTRTATDKHQYDGKELAALTETGNIRSVKTCGSWCDCTK